MLVNEGPHGIHHNGTGKLLLPSPSIGNKFMKIVYGRKNAIILNDRKLNFRKTDNKLPYPLMQELDKAPYMPPEKEEEREGRGKIVWQSSQRQR